MQQPYTIKQPIYDFLPIKAIRPTGWLRRQLRIQADGLSGHLDCFWPDIADSRWIGGSQEGWERVPYWLDGFIPLAWLLDDDDLKARASRYVEQILARQQADGWICPCNLEDRPSYDLWALFLILKTLTVYAEATEDPRIEPAIERALRNLDRHIDGRTLFGWAQTRWYEALISIYWLYRRQPAEWLALLAVKLHSQGFDFPALFAAWPYEQPAEKGRWSFMNHVVNQAMMLKGWALYSLLSGEAADREAAGRMQDLLDLYHGQVHGLFSGDECLAGLSPASGTELCAVVEYLYSMEHLLADTGEARWGDRLERAAFNALPATFDPLMWTHQYDQQVNQVECSTQAKPVFGTNGGQANLFGLEPNFGCCTANFSQGWPKFARSLFLRQVADGGLAIAAYAPAELVTEVHGVPVTISMRTDYPFRDTVRLDIEVTAACAFPLDLRVPDWAVAPTLQIQAADGQAAETLALTPGTMQRLARSWQGRTTINLRWPMAAAWLPRPENRIALRRGPLVYALPVAEEWRQINVDLPGHELPHADYELYAAGPWQYGLDEEQTADPARIVWQEHSVGAIPFSPAGAPVSALIRAWPVEWPMSGGAAAPVPASRKSDGPSVLLRLIPYGCTNLRLTEWPLVTPAEAVTPTEAEAVRAAL